MKKYSKQYEGEAHTVYLFLLPQGTTRRRPEHAVSYSRAALSTWYKRTKKHAIHTWKIWNQKRWFNSACLPPAEKSETQASMEERWCATAEPAKASMMEHFQFETLRVSSHMACRFAGKMRFIRHFGRDGTVPPPRVLPFSKGKTLTSPQKRREHTKGIIRRINDNHCKNLFFQLVI